MEPSTVVSAPLRWPPPGLERLQGDLWRVAARGALAGGILVLPMLFAAGRRPGFASLGPFADAWWVTLVLATVGLGFAVDTLASAGRLLRRAAEALKGGYDRAIVLNVAADTRKDMGFLLQGGRHFSVMEPAERALVARLRVLSVACHALAGVWLSSALGLTLLAAARGLLGDDAFWMVTLLPALVLYVAGGVAGMLEDGRVRKARTRWFRQPWAQDLDPREIEAWRGELADRQGRPEPPRREAGRVTTLRRAAVLTTVLAFVVAVPVLTLIPTSAIGPVLALLALPRVSQVQQRAARAEAFRGLRVAPDASVSPDEAGRILQDLLYVGASRPPGPGEAEPTTRYDAPWLPAMEGENPVGAEPHRWPEDLFPRVVEDPTPDLLAFLDGIAAHPAHAAFSRLARAEGLDAVDARWGATFPPGTTAATLPIPRFGGLREGAYAHLAAAAADAARGRAVEAETKIREVVSVGFLLGDQGPTLIDNLIGHVIVGAGGTAMERFYRAEGRDADARRLREMVETAERASLRVRSDPPEGAAAYVRALPSMVLDTAAVRGLRWEYFILTATLSPCLNLHRMVFGADDDFQAFVERARRSLVRWPSEERLFEVARAGYLGAVGDGTPSPFGRFLGISMRSGPGTCADVVGRFEALKEAF